VVKILVKELIEKLKDFNENSEVLIQSRYASYHFHINSVNENGNGKNKFIFIKEGKQELFDNK
jgi:hypothetical protein